MKKVFFVFAVLTIATLTFPLLPSELFASESLDAYLETPLKPVSDKTARVPVDWLKRGILYQINTRAFTPEGTLKAAEEKLPHIASLGVTIVYLCPVFVSDDDMDRKYWSARQKGSLMNNPKNPYRMKDYFHVDSEYGTDDDLKSFIKTAHSLNLKVMLDLVFFHCGPTAVFLEKHPEFAQRDADGNFVTGEWAFPRLNFKSQELREYLYSNMEYLLTDFDADGFRMDVGDLVPIDFWIEGRKRMEKIKPNVGTICEGMRGDDLLFAFDELYGFEQQFQYSKVFDKGQSVALLRKAKEKMARLPYPQGAQFMHCVENHDYANGHWVKNAPNNWYPRAEIRWGEKAMDAALVYIYTLDGTPMIYCGQEIADARRHSIFGKLSGSFIHWKEDAGTESAQKRLELVRKLAKIRCENRQFTDGKLIWLDNTTPNEVLSYVRSVDNARSLVLINFRDKNLETVITEEDGSKKTFNLAPFEWRILP